MCIKAVLNVTKHLKFGSLYFLLYFLKKNEKKKQKSLQHLGFQGGRPTKYYPGPTRFNFGDRTGTGVFRVVWP